MLNICNRILDFYNCEKSCICLCLINEKHASEIKKKKKSANAAFLLSLQCSPLFSAQQVKELFKPVEQCDHIMILFITSALKQF